jgi:type III secretion protein D
MLRSYAQPVVASRVEDGALRLEVLAGPRRGARLEVDPQRPLTIGHAFDDDVVIRHRSVRGVRARVWQEEGGLQLRVEAGTVSLLGMPLEAGRTVPLPRWVPFTLGDSVLAIGPKRGDGWEACRRLGRRMAVDRIAADAAAALPGPQPGAETDAPRAKGTVRWWRVPALLTAPGLIALAALLAWPAPPGGAPAADPQALQAVRAVLANEGLSHLRILQPARGGLELQGLVERDADRVRLADRFAKSGMPVRLDLGTGEQLARQVGDVLRLNGVAAQVRHVGRGTVEARFADPGAARRAQLEAAVRRDVPGLAALVVETSPATARAAPTAVEPGKRVVNVVYGPQGYVVTADGARYFEGAFLPSGHRIARIADDEVQLERDGQISRLSM